jgi:class 3 adenylate cyclase
MLERLGLRFADPAVERAFRAYHVEKSLPMIQVNGGTSLFVLVISHVMLLALVPTDALAITILFFTAMYPLLVAHTVFMRLRLIRAGIATGILSNISVSAGAIYLLQIRMDHDALALAVIIMDIFVGAGVVRLRVIHGLAMGIADALIYTVVMLAFFQHGSVAGGEVVMRMFACWSALMLGMLACYVGEAESRRAFVQERTIAAQREQILAEQAKSERLLLNVLPAPIAAILRDETRTIADHYDEASVLFADVAGFTPMSATMTPAELVELLNEVFSCFDDLAEKHRLEKIKTIGDCYMVAAGVPVARDDHAVALVRMALDVRDTLARRDFRGRKLSFRIGVNSGPVVAGVIGKKKFIYDLWGDAVNVASRMEAHGKGGEIQITRRTRELLGDRFECVAQGRIEVKGKGEMEIWHVTRELSVSSASMS